MLSGPQGQLPSALRRTRPWLVGVVATLAVLGFSSPSEAQGLTFSRGQSISPAFEGWEQNEDGSFNLVFGYMNRNWEDEPDIPVGPDNGFSPGPADRGQPTHFLPRRNRFTVAVQVPPDFGDQEIVWTINYGGEVLKAAANPRLMQGYAIGR